MGNSNPFNSFKTDKKAVVNLTTFSLIILLLIVVLLVSYFFYNTSANRSDEKIKELELVNSLSTFRAELVDLVVKQNASILYNSSVETERITIFLENTTLRATQKSKEKAVEYNMSSLGIRFCSDYNFTPSTDVNLSYNGSCVSKN